MNQFCDQQKSFVIATAGGKRSPRLLGVVDECGTGHCTNDVQSQVWTFSVLTNRND